MARSSAVQQPKLRTVTSARPGGIATQCSLHPTSMAAAFLLSTGKPSVGSLTLRRRWRDLPWPTTGFDRPASVDLGSLALDCCLGIVLELLREVVRPGRGIMRRLSNGVELLSQTRKQLPPNQLPQVAGTTLRYGHESTRD